MTDMSKRDEIQGSGVEMTAGMHDALVSLTDEQIRHAAMWLADRTDANPDLPWWEALTCGLVFELLAERYVRKHRGLEIDRAMARVFYVDEADVDLSQFPPLPTRAEVVVMQADGSTSLTPGDEPPPRAA